MSEQTTYVRIVGEPFLARARDYRERRLAWHRTWGTFAESKGADGFDPRGFALSFKSKAPPEGWTKPARENRMSRPKKGTPDAQVLQQMRADHPMPDGRDVFADAVPFNVSWEGEDGSRGGYALGGFGMVLRGPYVGWAGDVFLAHIPDAEAVARHFAEDHPDRRIVGPEISWTLPEGLTRITEAEYELVFAQHKVLEERSAAGRQEAAV